jgi:Uma2 family endonuclease
MPEGGEPEGIWPIAPDLAIEVISPNDLWERVQSKVQEYFAAGVRQVWLVSWQQGTVSIYDSPTHVTILTEEDILTSAALLPGFSCRVSDIFQQPARR